MPIEAQDAWKQDYAAHRARAKATRSGILYDYSQRSAFDVSEEERLSEYEARWAKGGANFTHAFNDIFIKKAANDTAAQFVHTKIAEIVNDPQIAAKLMPTDHPIGTKRICVDTDYYAMFNRPNVTLVDVRAAPILSVDQTGILTSEAHYAFDSIVFATGYDAVTGALARIEICGRGGEKLKAKWQDGPRTYLGLMSVGFPNMFVITGPGSPSVLTNMVMAIEQHVEWVADCLGHMLGHDIDWVEPTLEAENEWVDHVNAVADGTLFPQAASWYMGANIPGKPRIFLPYLGGLGNYTQICRDVAADGYRGFILGRGSG